MQFTICVWEVDYSFLFGVFNHSTIFKLSNRTLLLPTHNVWKIWVPSEIFMLTSRSSIAMNVQLGRCWLVMCGTCTLEEDVMCPLIVGGEFKVEVIGGGGGWPGLIGIVVLWRRRGEVFFMHVKVEAFLLFLLLAVMLIVLSRGFRGTSMVVKLGYKLWIEKFIFRIVN